MTLPVVCGTAMVPEEEYRALKHASECLKKVLLALPKNHEWLEENTFGECMKAVERVDGEPLVLYNKWY